MMKKRILMVIWMLAVPLVMIAAGVKAEAATSGDWEYEVISDSTYSEDTARITGYNGSGKELNIPDKLGGYTVSSIASWAFSNCNDVVEVTIPATITGNINANAFGRAVQTIEVDAANPVYCSENGILYDKRKETLVYCPSDNETENIIIPSTVTTISNYAFYYCGNIKTIEIPESVETIGAFYDHTQFDGSDYSLVFDDTFGDESSVFDGMNNLVSINVEEGNSTWSSNDGILYNEDKTNIILCPKSKSGEISILNTVTEIGSYAFSGCSKLENVVIPDTVTKIGSSAFSGCSSLESVTIPTGITEIAWGAFSRCSNLSSVQLPETVTEISVEAFAHCNKLGKVDLPKNLEIIDEGAFKDCVSLESIRIPANVRQIANTRSLGGSSFSECINLETIDVDSANSTFSSEDGIVYDKAGITLYLCPEGKTGTVNVPAGVTEISGFYECGKLTEIILPTSITEIDEYAFYNCKSLHTITIPDGVKSIGVLSFCGCTSLLEVTVPESVKEIGINAFGYWDEEITWGVVDRYKIENFILCGFTGSAAEQYAKEYDIPFKVITSMPDDEKYDEDQKPSNPQPSTPITKPSGSTSQTPAAAAPKPSTSTPVASTVKKGTIVADTKSKASYQITGDAASGYTVTYMRPTAKKAKTVTIPATVTVNGISCKVTSVVANAFKGQKKLKKVTIGANVATIGKKAFYGCKNLKKVTVKSKKLKKIGAKAFSKINNNAKIKLPKNKQKAYKKLFKKNTGVKNSMF